MIIKSECNLIREADGRQWLQLELGRLDSDVFGYNDCNVAFLLKDVLGHKAEFIRHCLTRFSIIWENKHICENSWICTVGQTIIVDFQYDVVLFIDCYIKWWCFFHTFGISQVGQRKHHRILRINIVIRIWYNVADSDDLI